MPTDHILDLLLVERDKLNRAIEALRGPTKRIGRPPKNLAAVATSAAPEPAAVLAPAKKTRKFSAYQRKKQAERMKAYWAAKKAAAEPKAKKTKKKAAAKKAAVKAPVKKATKKKAATKRAVKKTAPVQAAAEA